MTKCASHHHQTHMSFSSCVSWSFFSALLIAGIECWVESVGPSWHARRGGVWRARARVAATPPQGRGGAQASSGAAPRGRARVGPGGGRRAGRPRARGGPRVWPSGRAASSCGVSGLVILSAWGLEPPSSAPAAGCAVMGSGLAPVASTARGAGASRCETCRRYGDGC